MKTIFKDSKGNEIILRSEYTGSKPAPWSDKYTNYNHHRITVKTEHGRTGFDFWASIARPEIQTKHELKSAFECFVSDAIAGAESFEEFCGNFGYDTDSRKAEKIHKACKRAHDKLTRIYLDDIYELANELQDF